MRSRRDAVEFLTKKGNRNLTLLPAGGPSKNALCRQPIAPEIQLNLQQLTLVALQRTVIASGGGAMSAHNTLQVVTGDGVFNSENVKAFMRDHHLEAAGVDYSVVAITGPQSSGKSTLMNTLVRLHSTVATAFLEGQHLSCRLCCVSTPLSRSSPLMIWQLPVDDHLLAAVQFATSFEEMDAFSGRNQTTKGIWLAKSSKVASPTTLVMDLEGSDGRSGPEAQCCLQFVPNLDMLLSYPVIVRHRQDTLLQAFRSAAQANASCTSPALLLSGMDTTHVSSPAALPLVFPS